MFEVDIWPDNFFRNDIPFLRLDGTLNQQQREKVIKKFSEEDSVLVRVSH